MANFIIFRGNDYSECWINTDTIQKMKVTTVNGSSRVELFLLDDNMELKGELAAKFLEQMKELH